MPETGNAPRRILIIGAGAVGAVLGYCMASAGHSITFYVRPQRAQLLPRPMRLYRYDDRQSIAFSDFDLLNDPEAIAQTDYDYVIVTLDAHAACSDDGQQLLRAIGDGIRHRDTVLVSLAVGSNMHAHLRDFTGLPDARLLIGGLSWLSHQVPIPCQSARPEVDEAALADAHMAYTTMSNAPILLLEKRHPEMARRFADVLNHSGVARCSTISPALMLLVYNVVFPLLGACELAGWPPTDRVIKDRVYWPLGCRAASEIAALPKFGIQGRIASRLMVRPLLSAAWKKADRAARPLDYNAFNRFHHGEKVVAQDTQNMRDNLAEGQRAGIAMPALESLLQQLDAARSS